MRYLKYGLYVLGALIVLTGLVFGYIAAIFDPNVYKDDISRVVAEKTDRILSFDGDLQLTFFPKIGVTLAGARLSERGSETQFAGVDDLRVALALLPLLSGDVVVDEVVLDGLRARVIKRADGTMNIDDLMSLEQMEDEAGDTPGRVNDADGQVESADQAEATGDSDDAADRPPVILDIEGVRIVNAALKWNDEMAGVAYEVSELAIETGRIAKGVPTKFDYRATIRADQPAIELRTRASGTLSADFDNQIFKIDALEGGVEGIAATLSALDIAFSANVEARPDTDWIGLSELEVEASASMGEDKLKSKLSVPDLVVDKGAATVDQVTVSFNGVIAGADVSGKREPEMRADTDIRLTGVAASPQTLTIGELAIDVDASQADSSLKGRLTTVVTGDLQKQVFQLSRIAGQYELRSPALPMKSTTIPLAGAIGANLERETVHADLKIRFDQSDIEGVFDVKRFVDPFFRFDIGIDRLDVDRYMGNEQDSASDKSTEDEQKDGGRTGGDQKTGGQNEAPFDLTPLKSLNLAGELRIGTLIASGVTLSDVRFKVNAAGGKAEVNPFFARLYGGSTRGVVTANANNNTFSLKQTLSSVAIGPLLRDSLDQDLLDGRGTVELDLKARGNTVSALTSTLSGDASIALKDGSVKGINLAQSMRNAGDLLSLKRNRETAALSTEKTDFTDLTASFVIDKGKARNNDLSLRSPFIRLNGKGDIDMVEGGLDYLANVTLVATSSGQEGKNIADISGITVPVRIVGPMTALRYKLQFSDAIADQSRKLIEAEQKKLEKKFESELMEKLFDGDVPSVPAGNSGGEPDAPMVEPKDELRRQLKKLLR
jgi:AsmA protein